MSTDQNISDRVVAIVRNTLGISPDYLITQLTRFEQDLGADSIDMVEIVIELEDEFQIEIDGRDAGRLVVINDIVSLVQRIKGGAA